MARVEVTNATVNDGTIVSLGVRLSGLPPRTIDRDTVLAWMRDGHSFIPVVDGEDRPALHLVEIVDGDDVKHFVRADGHKESADQVPLAG